EHQPAQRVAAPPGGQQEPDDREAERRDIRQGLVRLSVGDVEPAPGGGKRGGGAEHRPRENRAPAWRCAMDVGRRGHRLDHGASPTAGMCPCGTGSVPATVVPSPVEERTSRVPPRAPRRSAIPCRPEPVPTLPGSKPIPSSRTSKDRLPPRSASSTDTSEALAYFATFCMASRQE